LFTKNICSPKNGEQIQKMVNKFFYFYWFLEQIFPIFNYGEQMFGFGEQMFGLVKNVWFGKQIFHRIFEQTNI
jgi:hypothetical protein